MEIFDEAKVIKVIDDYEIVINKGSEAGVQYKQEFLIYYFGEELQDPDTQESLGKLEILCGKAKVKHIQPLMTTLVSNEYRYKVLKRTIKNNSAFAVITGGQTTEETEPENEQLPFDDVKVGCLSKRIK